MHAFGTLLTDCAASPCVEWERCTSNDVWEVYPRWHRGVRARAVRPAQAGAQLRRVLPGERHLLMIVDTMCRGGTLMPLNRHGINCTDASPSCAPPLRRPSTCSVTWPSLPRAECARRDHLHHDGAARGSGHRHDAGALRGRLRGARAPTSSSICDLKVTCCGPRRSHAAPAADPLEYVPAGARRDGPSRHPRAAPTHASGPPPLPPWSEGKLGRLALGVKVVFTARGTKRRCCVCVSVGESNRVCKPRMQTVLSAQKPQTSYLPRDGDRGGHDDPRGARGRTRPSRQVTLDAQDVTEALRDVVRHGGGTRIDADVDEMGASCSCTSAWTPRSSTRKWTRVHGRREHLSNSPSSCGARRAHRSPPPRRA